MIKGIKGKVKQRMQEDGYVDFRNGRVNKFNARTSTTCRIQHRIFVCRSDKRIPKRPLASTRDIYLDLLPPAYRLPRNRNKGERRTSAFQLWRLLLSTPLRVRSAKVKVTVGIPQRGKRMYVEHRTEIHVRAEKDRSLRVRVEKSLKGRTTQLITPKVFDRDISLGLCRRFCQQVVDCSRS